MKKPILKVIQSLAILMAASASNTSWADPVAPVVPIIPQATSQFRPNFSAAPWYGVVDRIAKAKGWTWDEAKVMTKQAWDFKKNQDIRFNTTDYASFERFALDSFKLYEYSNLYINPKKEVDHYYRLPNVEQQVNLTGAYNAWQKVTLPASVATCADGSPYKFFVRLRENTTNLYMVMEFGGAVLDYEAASGLRAIRHNITGELYKRPGTDRIAYRPEKTLGGRTGPVKDNHLDGVGNNFSPILNTKIGYAVGLIGFEEFTPANDWNQIVMPYCSGDVFLGDKTSTYTSPDGTDSITFKHQGFKITMGVMGWIRQHLTRPGKMLLHGQSAGAVGLDVLRPVFSTLIPPFHDMVFLLDGGFVALSRLSKDPDAAFNDSNPTAPLYKKVFENQVGFNFDRPGDISPLKFVAKLNGNQNIESLSTYTDVNNFMLKSLEKKSGEFFKKRILYTFSTRDLNFSVHSLMQSDIYKRTMRAFDGTANEPLPKNGFHGNGANWIAKTFGVEIANLRDRIAKSNNPDVGFFINSGRQFNGAHTLTMFTWWMSDIYGVTRDQNIWLKPIIDKILTTTSYPVPRLRESELSTIGIDTAPYIGNPSLAFGELAKAFRAIDLKTYDAVYPFTQYMTANWGVCETRANPNASIYNSIPYYTGKSTSAISPIYTEIITFFPQMATALESLKYMHPIYQSACRIAYPEPNPGINGKPSNDSFATPLDDNPIFWKEIRHSKQY